MRIIEFIFLCIVSPILITVSPVFVLAQDSVCGRAYYELPSRCGENQIVRHYGYTLSYNELHEQADWVAYFLTRDRVENKVIKRTDDFRSDPLVLTGSADLADYKAYDSAGNHYDRGHLAPAADMAWAAEAMSESFYLSNMSPQTAGFNRGVWKRLEEQLRAWAVEYDTLLIATGPVLTDSLPKLGPNEVSIPEFYYKVIARINAVDTLGIGFILPNASSKLTIDCFAVPVDTVEAVTGIDFFEAFPDDVEECFESSVCLSCWSWVASSNGSNAPTDARSLSESVQQGSSVQCSAITKNGSRCKRMTSSPNGRCYQHGGN